MNELNQHKKSDSIKWIITFVALILLAISVVALGAKVFGDGVDIGITTEDDGNKTNPEVDSSKPESAEGLSTVQVVNSELMMLSAKAYSGAPTTMSYEDGNYIELVATINPASASDAKLKWFAVWADPESEFAKGKDVDDYICIDMPGASNVVCISANEAFGAQIKIVVYAEDNPDATAYCLVDYGQKFAKEQYLTVETDVFFQDMGMSNDGEWYVFPIISGTKQELIDAYHLNDDIAFSYIMEDVYTLDMCYDEFSYNVLVSQEFYDALDAAGLVTEDYHAYSFSFGTDLTAGQILNSLCCGDIVPLGESYTVDYDKINAFNQVVSEFGDGQAFYIEVNAVSEYDDQSYFFYFSFDTVNGSVEYVPTEIELDETNIIL